MPNDDLISRNALLKRFEKLKENPNNKLIDTVFLNGAQSVIDAAPAVGAEPVRYGKWKIINRNEARCSECKVIRNIGTQEGWNYCPNCGVKMDKEE